MVYATYNDYTKSYGGSAIPEANFQRLAVKASAYIDMFTFKRINEGNVSAFPSVSLCACEMAETIFFATGETGTKKEKKSENTDGYTVSYVVEGADGRTAEETLRRKLYEIAKLYLINTGLLYCGVDDLC
jgi:hypothetical protein